METKKCPKCLLDKDYSCFHSCKSRKICSYCKDCMYTLQKRRWRERKFKAIEIMGGKCSSCGYNKCYNALEFHHTDPSTKDYTWDRLRMMKWQRIIEEIKKCILVCANCHREIHAKNEDYQLSGADNRSLNKIGPESTGLCPNCQEPTYGTKYCSTTCVHLSQRKTVRPSREDLASLIKNKTYTALGIDFGVSDVAVKKWCKFYGLV